MLEPEVLDDAQLVALGLGGDREAFGRLVARYQSAVCALAYSACGDVARSEDLAQDAFITAWRKLGDLKEPGKFKSWLFAIARNLINSSFRRQARNPLASAEPLDESLAEPVTAPTPAGLAMSREEKEILWRSLAHIPETYREPLVLFYRENESVERVAAMMDLSEETVRQRLSRGRKLLEERVVAFVEGALRETAPGQAFTLGVITALPNLVPAAGSFAAGGAMGKAVASAGFFAVAKSLLAKVAPPVFFTWAMLKITESRRERIFMMKAMAGILLGTVLYYLAVSYLIPDVGRRYWDSHPQAYTLTILGSVFGFVAVMGPYAFWMARGQRRIQKEEAKQRPVSLSQSYEYRSTYTLLGLPLVHIHFGTDEQGNMRTAKGWIAIGTKAYGVLYAAGALAVGGISCGAQAVGIIAIGGFGVGVFAFGGMALGILALGGASIGYLAFGGGAIGWLGAMGGATLARHYAVGGGAIAEHANDHAAYAFVHSNLYFQSVYHIFFVLFLFTWIVPSGSIVLFKWRRERSARMAQAAKTLRRIF